MNNLIRVTLYILVVFSVFSLSCSDGNEKYEAGQTIIHEEGFSFRLPKRTNISVYDFGEFIRDESALVHLSGPQQNSSDIFFINIHKFEIGEEETILDAINWKRERQRRPLTNNLNSMEVVEIGTGLKGWSEFGISGSREEFFNENIYILRNNNVLIFSFFVLHEELENYYPVFQELIKSISFNE